MDLKTYYNFLIKVGQNYYLGQTELISQVEYIIKASKKDNNLHLTPEDLNFYNNLTSQFNIPCKGELQDLSLFSNDEILLLFKGFIIVDNDTGPINGSVSAGIQIYQHIERRQSLDRSRITMITDWSLRHSKNTYIPFGMSNRGTNLVDHVVQQQQYVLSKSEEPLNAEINKMKKRFKGFENKIHQLEKEKSYLRSIISEFNEEAVLEAKKRVISNRKFN